MENPNEYNDEEFLEASNRLQSELTSLLDRLWNAGASVSDIEVELASAFENTMMAGGSDAVKGEGIRVRVSL